MSTGSRTSRTGRGRRGEDGGARRGREARWVEDVADTRGLGDGAASRGEVRGVMATLIVEDRGVVGHCVGSWMGESAGRTFVLNRRSVCIMVDVMWTVGCI